VLDDVEDRIAAAAAEIAASLSLELVEVSLKRAPKRYRLAVTVDKEGGVTLDECTKMSQALSQWLDATDPLPGSYNLQVASPGLDRPVRGLDDFRVCRGRFARITLRVDGKENQILGTIGGVGDDGRVEVTDKAGRVVRFAIEDVVRAKLDVDFGRPASGGKGQRR